VNVLVSIAYHESMSWVSKFIRNLGPQVYVGKKQEHTSAEHAGRYTNPLFTFPILATSNLFVLVTDLDTDLCRVEYSLRE
jgi:hypothetical protein